LRSSGVGQARPRYTLPGTGVALYVLAGGWLFPGHRWRRGDRGWGACARWGDSALAGRHGCHHERRSRLCARGWRRLPARP